MTTILNGKILSEEILNSLAQKISVEAKKPHLVVILVGDDPASHLYVSMKEKAAQKVDIKSTVLRYPAETSEKEILDAIVRLNGDDEVSAILIQLPVPKHINEQKIIQAISPRKDVDGLTPENIGKISIGSEPYAYPCTPKGIMKLIEKYDIDLAGRHTVVIGRSNLLGKPVAQMILNKNSTVTICHSYTKNLKEITKTADIIVAAVGKPYFVTKDMVKDGCVIIDAGTSKLDGKTVGDVDFNNIKDLASAITPVPGGVGPMTIAVLMENTYELFKIS